MAKIIDMTIEQFARVISARVNEIYNKTNFKTQDELVEHLNRKGKKTSSATISVLKSGNHNVSAYNLALVVEALGGSLDYVVFGEEHKPLLSDFQSLLNQVRNESIDISDQDIKEIILALSEYKKTDVKKFEILKRIFTRGDKELENTVINIIELLYKKAE